MSYPGIGAMMHILSGGSPKSPRDYYGRTIVAASMVDDALTLAFADGVKIKIWDNGQSCCESRYMRTDDDVSSLVGHKLTNIEAKDAGSEPSDCSTHDVCFVEVATDDGHITIANHNEHNGYYGGFGLSVDEIVEG